MEIMFDEIGVRLSLILSLSLTLSLLLSFIDRGDPDIRGKSR